MAVCGAAIDDTTDFGGAVVFSSERCANADELIADADVELLVLARALVFAVGVVGDDSH